MEFFTAILLLAMTAGAYGSNGQKRHFGRTIFRPNYGVTLEKLGNVITTANYWHHTFVKTLPNPRKILPDDNKGDRRVNILPLRPQTLELAGDAARLLEFAKERLPQLPSDTEDRRIKRSAGKDLFGTATVNDVKKVATMINKLASSNALLPKEIRIAEHNRYSYMKIADKRMDGMIEMMNTQLDELYKLEESYKAVVLDKDRQLEWMVGAMTWQANRQYGISKFSNMLLGLTDAVGDLSKGILSDGLITDADFNIALNELRKYHASIGKDVFFMDTIPQTYYKSSDFTAFVNGTDIWITIKIPVGIRKALHLYQTKTWQVPIYDHSSHATLIENLPELVAIDESMGYIGIMTNTLLQNCRGNSHTRFCPFSVPLRKMKGDECIDAIVEDNRGSIHQSCKFNLMANTIRPNLVEVFRGSVLVQASLHLKLRCGRKEEKQIKGCHHCLIKVPCNCILRATDFEYTSPTTARCTADDKDKDVKRQHMVNLAVLRTFEREGSNILDQLDSEETFAERMENISGKRFKALDKYFDELKDRDVDTSNNIKDIGNNQQQIVKETDTVANSMLYSWNSGLFVSTGIGQFLIVMFVLLVLLGVLFVIFVFKARKIYLERQKTLFLHRSQIASLEFQYSRLKHSRRANETVE